MQEIDVQRWIEAVLGRVTKFGYFWDEMAIFFGYFLHILFIFDIWDFFTFWLFSTFFEKNTLVTLVLDEPFPDGKLYEDTLKDGVILCKLMNILSPGSISKITTTGPNFKLMENVTR